ncbi:MAG: tetratricopeptide repeat protein [Pseudomonadota bacterium]
MAKDDDEKKKIEDILDSMFDQAIIDPQKELGRSTQAPQPEVQQEPVPEPELPGEDDEPTIGEDAGSTTVEMVSDDELEDLNLDGSFDSGEFAEIEVDDDDMDAVEFSGEVTVGGGAGAPEAEDEGKDGDVFDEVVVDQFPEIAAGDGEIAGGVVMEQVDWSVTLADLEQEVNIHPDPLVGARMLAEMGRITEKRIGDLEAALCYYEEALVKDPSCLLALQGRRRVQIAREQLSDALESLELEKGLASDPAITRRLENIQAEIGLWENRDPSQVSELDSLRKDDPHDPYFILMSLFDAISRKDIELAARQMEGLASLSEDNLFISALKACSALLHETIGAPDEAARLYDDAIAEGGEGFDRAVDLAVWRLKVGGRQWIEAGKAADISFGEADSPLIRGHRFLQAAQMLFVLGQPEEAEALIRLLPPSTSSLFLNFLANLGSGGSGNTDILKDFDDRLPGPPQLKGALRWILAESSPEVGDRISWYQRCMETDPGLMVPALELVELIAGADDPQYYPVLESILEECRVDVRRRWISGHVGLKLMESGKGEEGQEALRHYIQDARDEDFVWLLSVLHLARNNIRQWVELMGDWSGLITDTDALLGVKLLQADVNEHVLEDRQEADTIRINLLSEGAPVSIPFHCLAFHPEHAGDAVLFNSDMIMEYLAAEGGADLAAAAMKAVSSGAVEDAGERAAIYRTIMELKPGHLPAFCALRRELLSAGKFEEYFEVLNDFLNVSQRLDMGLLGSDRMTLLWLSKESLIYEEDVKKFLESRKNDVFVPIYLSTLDVFPRLVAEATESIASQMPREAAMKWWFEAARKWAGLDADKMASCLERLDDETWKRAGEGLAEIDCWVRQEWSGLTERLLAQLKQIEEGEGQVPILSRMAYIDGLLKEETQIGLAEVQSILHAGGLPPLIELRMLFKQLLGNKSLEALFPVLMAMSKRTVGSEESRIWAWLAYRLGRDVPSNTNEVMNELLGNVEVVEGDVPLLLVKELIALGNNDVEALATVLESLVGLIEGNREKGCLQWLLAILLSEANPDAALAAARAALEKVPVNPGCAFITDRIAALKEDWSTSAMSARLAGSLFRESEHAVEQLLRAADMYRDRIGETGWALQCYEQVLTIDAANEKAFEGLRVHFMESTSWDRLASLIEGRLAQIEDEQEELALRYALADTYEKAGRLPEAVEIVAAIVDTNPESRKALELQADYSMRGGQWEQAASALQQLLSLKILDEEKVEIFMKLGDIYVNQLPDVHRAIYCYEKVNENGPLDLEVAEKLVGLYIKVMSYEKGLEQAQLLFESSDDPLEKMKWLLVAGKFFEEGAKDLRKAEKAFETARSLAPAAHEPIVHLIRLYQKKDDAMALNFLLQRAIGDILVFQSRSPEELSLYHTIMHIIAEGGDTTGTRIMGTLLKAFGELLPDETLILKNSGGPITWAGGPWVASEGVEEHLVSQSMTPSFRLLLQRLSESLMKSIPVDQARYGISRSTKLQKRFGQDESILDEVAGWFRVKKPQVHIVNVIPNMLGVLAGSPPMLVIGEPLYAQLTPQQKYYVFAWGCKLLQSSFLPLLSVPEDQLPALWVAMIQQFEPSFFLSGVSAKDTGYFSGALRKGFNKKLKEELFGVALECSSDPNINVTSLYTELCTYADRAALLACGSIEGAVALHWRLHGGGEAPVTSGAQIQDILSESPVMARMAEFIISGALSKCLAHLGG